MKIKNNNKNEIYWFGIPGQIFHLFVRFYPCFYIPVFVCFPLSPASVERKRKRVLRWGQARGHGKPAGWESAAAGRSFFVAVHGAA